MREAFAHDATLDVGLSGDDAAPGAAITAALCGHWEHPPPCPLAPHHTQALRQGHSLLLRTLFAVEPELERDVRQRIDAALASSVLVRPDGVTARWQLLSSGPGEVLPSERDHVRRLVQA